MVSVMYGWVWGNGGSRYSYLRMFENPCVEEGCTLYVLLLLTSRNNVYVLDIPSSKSSLLSTSYLPSRSSCSPKPKVPQTCKRGERCIWWRIAVSKMWCRLWVADEMEGQVTRRRSSRVDMGGQNQSEGMKYVQQRGVMSTWMSLLSRRLAWSSLLPPPSSLLPSPSSLSPHPLF